MYYQKSGMMRTTLKKYDIWLAKVFFEDSEDYKERPVLILNNTVVLISAYKITSKGKTGAIQSPIKQWKEAGLDKESYIVYEKALRLERTMLIRKLGRLQIADIYALEMKLMR